MKQFLLIFFLFGMLPTTFSQIEKTYQPNTIQLFDYRSMPIFGLQSLKKDTIYFENGKIASITNYPTNRSLMPINNQRTYKTTVFYNRCGEAYLKSEYIEYGNPMMYGIMGPQYTQIDTKLSNTTCLDGITNSFSQKP